MAIRDYVITQLEGNSFLITWSGLLNGDTGQPYPGIAYPDRSAHVHGTFSTGGTVAIEGSNDAASFVALTDPQGNALAITAEKIEAVSELVREIRPNVTGGDGSTDLIVSMVVKG